MAGGTWLREHQSMPVTWETGIKVVPFLVTGKSDLLEEVRLSFSLFRNMSVTDYDF